jgi:membrane protein implicated in regulation of membrane protease activity
MRLADAIILSLCVAVFIMGVYETMAVGMAYAYWLFMLSVGLLLWYNHRRRKGKETDKKRSEAKPSKKKKSPRR